MKTKFRIGQMVFIVINSKIFEDSIKKITINSSTDIVYEFGDRPIKYKESEIGGTADELKEILFNDIVSCY